MTGKAIKGWGYFLVVVLFFAGLELLREEAAWLPQLLLYIFHGLMVISAFVAALAVTALIVNWWIDEPENTEASLIIQFLLAGALFCLAAICVKLWGGFPA